MEFTIKNIWKRRISLYNTLQDYVNKNYDELRESQKGLYEEFVLSESELELRKLAIEERTFLANAGIQFKNMPPHYIVSRARVPSVRETAYASALYEVEEWASQGRSKYGVFDAHTGEYLIPLEERPIGYLLNKRGDFYLDAQDVVKNEAVFYDEHKELFRLPFPYAKLECAIGDTIGVSVRDVSFFLIDRNGNEIEDDLIALEATKDEFTGWRQMYDGNGNEGKMYRRTYNEHGELISEVEDD